MNIESVLGKLFIILSTSRELLYTYIYLAVAGGRPRGWPYRLTKLKLAMFFMKKKTIILIKVRYKGQIHLVDSKMTPENNY